MQMKLLKEGNVMIVSQVVFTVYQHTDGSNFNKKELYVPAKKLAEALRNPKSKISQMISIEYGLKISSRESATLATYPQKLG